MLLIIHVVTIIKLIIITFTLLILFWFPSGLIIHCYYWKKGKDMHSLLLGNLWFESIFLCPCSSYGAVVDKFLCLCNSCGVVISCLCICSSCGAVVSCLYVSAVSVGLSFPVSMSLQFLWGCSFHVSMSFKGLWFYNCIMHSGFDLHWLYFLMFLTFLSSGHLDLLFFKGFSTPDLVHALPLITFCT